MDTSFVNHYFLIWCTCIRMHSPFCVSVIMITQQVPNKFYVFCLSVCTLAADMYKCKTKPSRRAWCRNQFSTRQWTLKMAWKIRYIYILRATSEAAFLLATCFSLREEIGVPRRNPHRYWENIVSSFLLIIVLDLFSVVVLITQLYNTVHSEINVKITIMTIIHCAYGHASKAENSITQTLMQTPRECVQ